MLNYSGIVDLNDGSNKVLKLINKYLTDYDRKQIKKIKNSESLDILTLNDFFIAGGAIKSVLYNQSPNDYDVYFRDVNIAKIVLNAIARVEDGDIQVHDESPLKENVEYESLCLSKMTVAKLFDMEVDLVMEFNESNYNYMIPKLDEDSTKAKITNIKRLYNVDLEKDDLPTFYSSCVVTFGNHNIQLIFGVVNDDPKKLVENFDFKHTQIVYDPFANEIVAHDDDVYISLLTKELFFTRKTKFPVSSLARQRKYIQEGFKSNYKNDIKLSIEINKLDLNDPITFFVQITGMDIVFINKLIENDDLLDFNVNGNSSTNNLMERILNRLDFIV